MSSTKANPPTYNPEDFAWILSEDDSYKMKLFDRHAAPSALEISITECRAWDSAKDIPECMIIFSE